MKKLKILVINGVNLNLLGKRPSEHYGSLTLKELNRAVKSHAASVGVYVRFFQSNSESRIIRRLQTCRANGVILNAGAYSHTSLAIADCVEALKIPVAEVHLSNIAAREPIRKIRMLERVAAACFSGKKEQSYFEAVDFLRARILNGGATEKE